MESPQGNSKGLERPKNQALDERPSAAPQTQEEVDRQARIAYLKSLAPSPKPRKRRTKIVVIIIAVFFVLAGAGLAVILLTGETPPKKELQSTDMRGIQEELRKKPDPNKTNHREAPVFGLSFDYPATWTMADTDSQGRLTGYSPLMKLKSADGQTSNAKVRLIIQPKQSTIKEFAKGNGLAVLDSEKLTYTKPSPSQRGQTYLSFVNYPSSSAKGIDALYITGDIGYQKDQAVPMVDIIRVDPLITIDFVQCPNEACNGALAPFTLDVSNWQSNANLSQAIKTVLTTLSIQ